MNNQRRMIAWLVCVSVVVPAAALWWMKRQNQTTAHRHRIENEQLRERIAHLEQQCRAAIERLNSHRGDLQTVAAQLRERETALVAAQQVAATRLSDNALLQAETERLSARLSELQANFNRTCATHAEQLTALTAERDALLQRRRASDDRQMAATVAAERDVLVAEVAALREQLTAAQQQVSHVSTERDSAVRQVAAVSAELAMLRQQHTEVLAQRGSLTDELSAAQTVCATLKSNLSSVSAELATLREQHTATMTQRSSLADELTAAQAQCATLKRVSDTMRVECEAARKERDELLLHQTVIKTPDKPASRQGTPRASTPSPAVPIASPAAADDVEAESSSDDDMDLVLDSSGGGVVDDGDDVDSDGTTDVRPAIDGVHLLAARTRARRRSESLDLAELQLTRLKSTGSELLPKSKRNALLLKRPLSSRDMAPSAEAAAIARDVPPAPVIRISPLLLKSASQRASIEVMRLWTEKWAKHLQLLVRLQALARGARQRRAYLYRVRRTNIVKEIVETEESYVRHLEHLVAICRDLLSSGLVPQRTVVRIFSNVEVLCYFQREFFSILASTVQTQHGFDAKIANIFLFSVANWRAYVYYVNGYTEAVAVVQRLEKTNAKFKQFVAKQTHRVAQLDLYDLLIMPVQRVPRYILLLAELRRFTPDSHPDAAPIDTALQELRQLASFIDSGSQASERMRELSQLLVGWRGFPSALGRLCAQGTAGPVRASPSADISTEEGREQFLHPARRLIREGHVIAADGKLRILLLLNDHLLVCKAKGKKAIKVKQLIVLTSRSTAVVTSASEPFELIVNDIKFRFQSAEGRAAWLASIRSAIGEQEALEKTIEIGV